MLNKDTKIRENGINITETTISEHLPNFKSDLKIRPLQPNDIPLVTYWSRMEDFAPGKGDVGIYSHTDRQGVWLGLLDNKPVGCIAGVRYNPYYGFIGLFIVSKAYRGNGYGIQLWKHALEHLRELPCIGLEAAPERIDDYESWGFKSSSTTTRWKYEGDGILSGDESFSIDEISSLRLIDGKEILPLSVQRFDSKREPSPRPHFLSDWLSHPAGKVLVLVDENQVCHGFGRIRPCLLKNGYGWRVGPLLADTPRLAELLIRRLLQKHPGIVYIDSPGINPNSKPLLNRLGFAEYSSTLRMYKGSQPPISMNDVYGLACLELG